MRGEQSFSLLGVAMPSVSELTHQIISKLWLVTRGGTWWRQSEAKPSSDYHEECQGRAVLPEHRGEATNRCSILQQWQVKKRDLTISNNHYHQGVPYIIVVVDGGWSKSSHKHSYNAKSGVGIILGLHTKIYRSYYSLCAVAEHKEESAPQNTFCYHN